MLAVLFSVYSFVMFLDVIKLEECCVYEHNIKMNPEEVGWLRIGSSGRLS